MENPLLCKITDLARRLQILELGGLQTWVAACSVAPSAGQSVLSVWVGKWPILLKTKVTPDLNFS